ncbi:hypothetical protein HGRIS_009379 [Hohenbuehelia grisea]|uniref:DUF6699 domain-containing protein n=1 Tax=Hohenbuehelia grisea TaxID=104357 RepID=A0ABR3J161_9AGAR
MAAMVYPAQLSPEACAEACNGCFSCRAACADYAYVPRIETPRWQRTPLPGAPGVTPYPATPYFTPFARVSWPQANYTPANPVMSVYGPSRRDGTPLWMPGTYPPVPFGIAVPVQLHPLLITNPNNPAVPTLQWDVTQRPHTAKQYTGRELIVTPNLDEVATAQKATKILVYSTTPSLASWMQYWGGIDVERHDGKAITIYDLMDAIQRYFQIPLTYDEVEMACEADPSNIARFNDAAYWRIRSSSQFWDVEKAQGIKRADVLGDFRFFQGLRPFWHEGFWIVYLELLGRPAPHRLHPY